MVVRAVKYNGGNMQEEIGRTNLVSINCVSATNRNDVGRPDSFTTPNYRVSQVMDEFVP